MIRLNYSTLLYSTRLPVLTFSHFNYWFKSSPLNEFLVTCQHQATAFDVPFYDIFAPTKNSCFEVSDDVIACDLRFGPPPIKNPGYAYAAGIVDLPHRVQKGGSVLQFLLQPMTLWKLAAKYPPARNNWTR